MNGRAEGKDPAWLESLIALSLSIAGLATAWSSNQSSLWDGEQVANYSRANATRVEASRMYTQAGQQTGVDIMLFSAWLDAASTGKHDLQAFYQARFRPEFRPAFEAWRAQQPLKNPLAAPTPFATPDYKLAARAEAERLEAKATAIFERGQADNGISDVYALATVLLAGSMFFAGICQTFHQPRIRIAVALLAALACVLGVLRAATLPYLTIPIF